MRKQIFVARESVCAADDLFAPHLKKWPASQAKSVNQLMQKLKDEYLPCNIQGGKATWIVKSKGTTLAIIAQEWKKCKNH
jgi:hypothetical protein